MPGQVYREHGESAGDDHRKMENSKNNRFDKSYYRRSVMIVFHLKALCFFFFNFAKIQPCTK